MWSSWTCCVIFHVHVICYRMRVLVKEPIFVWPCEHEDQAYSWRFCWHCHRLLRMNFINIYKTRLWYLYNVECSFFNFSNGLDDRWIRILIKYVMSSTLNSWGTGQANLTRSRPTCMPMERAIESKGLTYGLTLPLTSTLTPSYGTTTMLCKYISLMN